jgi:hypothetical protein
VGWASETGKAIDGHNNNNNNNDLFEGLQGDKRN